MVGVKKIVGLPWFLHKSVRGVRLRKQGGSKWFVKRIAKNSNI